MTSNRSKNVLATDLDGTLIPLQGHPENVRDLLRLKELLTRHEVELVFVTGRHFESVIDAIDEYELPATNWIICDVGTTICRRDENESHGFKRLASYAEHLDTTVAAMDCQSLKERLESSPGLRIQESEKQGPFKLSYYADRDQLASLVPQLEQQLADCEAPWSMIHSVDPFNGDGLVDFVPRNVSKAYALSWWAAHTESDVDQIIFAGDSGNDLAALASGYKSIIVGNADREVADTAMRAHRDAGWENRLHRPREVATSGVLSGCLHYWA